MPDIRMLTVSPGVEMEYEEKALSMKRDRQTKSWDIKASPLTKSQNPLRALLAEMAQTTPQTSKPILNLGLGDPTGLHPPPPASISSMIDTLNSGLCNGYIPGPGTPEAKRAVAEYHNRWDGVSYAEGDIVLTHGVGHALDTIFHVLFPPQPTKSNILLPRPGFTQYSMLLSAIGVEVRYYSLIEEKDWEADLRQLEGLVDGDTRAIVVTNPSNPCGSNFSKRHLLDILDIADRHKVPIIADEIYGHMTFTAPFIPLASLSLGVPIITLTGLSKRFLLPGWRIGWIALHDPLGVASEIKDGMHAWSNRFMGPSSVVQASLPRILLSTSPGWFDSVMQLVRRNAEIVSRELRSIPLITSSQPQGSLYMLLKLDSALSSSFSSSSFASSSENPQDVVAVDDMAFCKALYADQGVFLMPGSMFDAPGYVRLVIASEERIMEDVMDRLREFCAKF